MPLPLRRWHTALRDLWDRARREHSTPREIGWSVGVGAFVACTPLLGFHVWIALVLATVLRLNRLWTVIASHLSSTPVIVFCEIEAAHRLRTGRWAPLSVHDALAHGRELLLDWILGSGLVGGLFGITVGLCAYGIARWRSSLTTRTRAQSPRRSSESTPSRPPTPTP